MKSSLIFLFILFSLSSFASNQYVGLSTSEFLQLPAFNSPININEVDVSLIEAGVFYLSNQYRIKKSKKPLSYNQNLSFAAYTHSEQMNLYHFFDHVNKKNRDLATLEKRADYAGYRNYHTLAENIFYGYIDLSHPGTYKELSAFISNSFISSKGHRENLLANDVNELGCGIHFESQSKQGFWYFNFTQDFGSSSLNP